MASRQLGKLRQWAGEVISSRERTSFGDNFKELERDVEFRREGARRLYLATETYQRSLSKKKMNEALDEAEKLLPIDALGVVMIVHGEEYGDDSVFGNSLVKLGRAHCKTATLQDAFALTLRDTFMSFLLRFGEEIKEYDAIRKKLESKRLSYDAAIAKAEKFKNSKKEKDRREAEEELERAQYRYEEALEDVRAHMHAIQENEIAQHRELTGFLDMTINYVQQYLEVLMEVKADWQTKPNSIRRNSIHSRTKSQKQTKYSSLRVPSSVRTDPTPSQDSSDDESISATSRRRSSSIHGKLEAGSRPGSVPNSRPSSRAASRMSMKRSDSSATIAERDKDTEKDKGDKSKRKSVAGWASNAVGSVTGIGKKNKDKERFSELQDDHDTYNDPSPRTRRSGSFRSAAEKRSVTKSSQQKKLVRALKDFQGESDELSFKAGDKIVVINEVLDEWWLGSLNNQTGLFPTTYVEVLSGKPDQWIIGEPDSEDESAQVFHMDMHDHGASDLDDYGDHARKPLSPHPRPIFTGPSDAMSITSSGHDDEESNLVPKKNKEDAEVDDSRWGNNYSGPPALPMRRSTTTDVHRFTMPASLSPSSSRKSIQPPPLPPPPPPRRSTTFHSATPPVPERRMHGLRPTISTSTVSSAEGGKGSYHESPFEGMNELAGGGAGARADQNPF
ncbi:hypothetical protein AX15_007140 [Amanita polypyramis BW_CC]|nr:hypothetical protein AX15_007140 [Amanita polypyramis BW_CC]